MQYDIPDVCQRCVDHNCDEFCNPPLFHRETVAKAQKAIGDNAEDLGSSMGLAINDTKGYQDPTRAVMARLMRKYSPIIPLAITRGRKRQRILVIS